MFKTWAWKIYIGILSLFIINGAYAITCESNEFEYDGQCIESKFEITTTDEVSAFVFKFQISAKGTFYVDWGDGNIQQIIRSNTTITQYSHSFSAGQYTIKFGGLATEYNTSSSPYTPAIRFGEDANGAGGNSASNLYSISGSLGAIFPTVGSGEVARYRPHFNTVFRNCTNLTGTIPDDLFGRIVNGVYQGISGIPVGHMFNETFSGCSGLTGSIPEILFGREVNGTYYGISGAPMTYMFNGTFYGCSGLTGSIPENLFGRYVNGTYYGISGTPSAATFRQTFRMCSKLTGSIPEGLFAGISGSPASSIFAQTFMSCSNLTGTNIDDIKQPGYKYAVPPNLFSGISGKPNNGMFDGTFQGCSNLTGTIPQDLFGRVVNGEYIGINGAPANRMYASTFYGCKKLTGSIPENLFGRVVNGQWYGVNGSPKVEMFSGFFYLDSGLTGSIPNNLFGQYINGVYYGIKGAPATHMFYYTFSGCSGLTGSIPGNLFAGIVGKPAGYMFYSTFYNCSGLTGAIPGNLFAGISGAPSNYMFEGTFKGCSKLTGSIPAGLFSGIIGKPRPYMFNQTFSGCTNLGKDSIGGTSTYYVPPELFAGIDTNTTTTNLMNGVFLNTGLLTTCPVGTSQYTTGFESYFSSRKSCTSCPVAYPDYATDTQQCYAQVTFIDSDNNTLLKTEDVYYDAQSPDGFNLPSYSPVKPDTILENWTTGSGTVIGANDVLTGNQVVYSDWGFHCDSGHYFHVSDNEQICVAESKRTEHALVIQPDANHTYYIHATPNSEHDYTINSSSIHKMKANYNGTIYNLHDASVYFSE